MSNAPHHMDGTDRDLELGLDESGAAGACHAGIRRRTVLMASAGAVPVVAGVVGGSAAAQAAPFRRPDAAVTGLTVEHRTDPLGLDATRPRFGWRMRSEARGRSQGAYQILVASSPDRLTAGRADVWNSGRVRSADSVAVRYAGRPLRASTRYHWTVTVWDAEGRPVGTAPPAFFETGLMSTDGVGGWEGAQWIGMKGKAPNSAGAPMLRKEAALKDRPKVREARLYVSALGVYEAYLNGRHVTVEQDGGTTTELLPPGSTNYDARVNYMTYDVTELVTWEPDVTLAVVLGNGWYNGRISDGSTYYSQDGNALAVKAKLLIRYADGTSQTVVTGPDGGWKATDTGPYRADDIYDGQTYDAARSCRAGRRTDSTTPPGRTWNASRSTTGSRRHDSSPTRARPHASCTAGTGDRSRSPSPRG